MPCSFQTLDGDAEDFDLDAVYDFVRGYSKKRAGWTSLVVYVPLAKAFVELRGSPPDVRGNSRDEAEEVTDEYLRNAYGVSDRDIASCRSKPKNWVLIDQRG